MRNHAAEDLERDTITVRHLIALQTNATSLRAFALMLINRDLAFVSDFGWGRGF